VPEELAEGGKGLSGNANARNGDFPWRVFRRRLSRRKRNTPHDGLLPKIIAVKQPRFSLLSSRANRLHPRPRRDRCAQLADYSERSRVLRPLPFPCSFPSPCRVLISVMYSEMADFSSSQSSASFLNFRLERLYRATKFGSSSGTFSGAP